MAGFGEPIDRSRQIEIPHPPSTNGAVTTVSVMPPAEDDSQYSSVKIMNVSGTSAAVKSTIIATPISKFTYTAFAAGLVTFTNTSLNRPVSFYWTFGDGVTSTVENPSHTYSSPGTYPVTLKVTDNHGRSSSSTQNVVLTLPAEAVDFTYTFSGLGIQFTNTSTIYGSYAWDFGDGTGSTEESPYHLYEEAGVYDITLTLGGESRTHTVAIDTGITLTWQDNSTNETGFKIERSPNGSSSWSQIATTGAGVTTLLVTYNTHGVDPAVPNYFRVRAYNAYGDSAYSNTASRECS